MSSAILVSLPNLNIVAAVNGVIIASAFGGILFNVTATQSIEARAPFRTYASLYNWNVY